MPSVMSGCDEKNSQASLLYVYRVSHFLFNGLVGSNSGSAANNILFCKSLSSFKIGTLLSCPDYDIVPMLDFVLTIIHLS